MCIVLELCLCFVCFPVVPIVNIITLQILPNAYKHSYIELCAVNQICVQFTECIHTRSMLHCDSYSSHPIFSVSVSQHRLFTLLKCTGNLKTKSSVSMISFNSYIEFCSRELKFSIWSLESWRRKKWWERVSIWDGRAPIEAYLLELSAKIMVVNTVAAFE